ncbi:MAG: hypothetical protein U1A22_13425, partial [Xanthomonadaceae bacterium]|nr:hypothetical protein [Xanthomonadaceae bacterium]
MFTRLNLIALRRAKGMAVARTLAYGGDSRSTCGGVGPRIRQSSRHYGGKPMRYHPSLPSIISAAFLSASLAASGWVHADPPEGSLFIVGTALEGETVTTDNDISDADGLGEFRYRWFLDGTVVVGATSASFVLD